MTSFHFYYVLFILFILTIIVFYFVRYAIGRYRANKFNSRVKNIGNVIYYDRIPMNLGFNFKLNKAKVYFEFEKGKLTQIDLRTKDKASLWLVRQRTDSVRFTAYCYSKENKGISCDIFYSLYGFPTTVNAWVEWLNKSIPNLKLPAEQFVTV